VICPACRTEVSASSFFCPNCGNHLTKPRPLDQLPIGTGKAIRQINTGSLLFGFGLVVAIGGAVAPFVACILGGPSSMGCYSVTRFYATSLPIVVSLGITVFALGLGMMIAAPRNLPKRHETIA
jgi:hypothetical protein